MCYTLTSFNEISSKADIFVGDMEHTHQGMLLRAHTHTHTHTHTCNYCTDNYTWAWSSVLCHPLKQASLIKTIAYISTWLPLLRLIAIAPSTSNYNHCAIRYLDPPVNITSSHICSSILLAGRLQAGRLLVAYLIPILWEPFQIQDIFKVRNVKIVTHTMECWSWNTSLEILTPHNRLLSSLMVIVMPKNIYNLFPKNDQVSYKYCSKGPFVHEPHSPKKDAYVRQAILVNQRLYLLSHSIEIRLQSYWMVLGRLASCGTCLQR